MLVSLMHLQRLRTILCFSKLCHGCGACRIACKYNAITYDKREIGKIEIGYSHNINCSRGILNISEPMAIPVIKELLKIYPVRVI